MLFFDFSSLNRNRRCQKGKSCSATCIAREDDCLLDFPAPVQEALKRVVEQAMARGSITEGSKEDRELGQAFSDMFSLYGRSVIGSGEKGQSIYHPKVAALYADFQKTGRTAVQRVPVSDEDLNRIWSSLPSNIRSDLRKKGSPPKGVDKDDSRGRMILRNLLETGFRDEITGQPHSWKDLQPDHRIPVANFPAGKKHESENPENLVMVHKGYNSLKGALERKGLNQPDPIGFVKKRLFEVFTKQSEATVAEYRASVSRAKERETVQREINRQIKDNYKLWTPKEFKEQVMSLNREGLKTLVKEFEKEDDKTARVSPKMNRGGSMQFIYPPVSILQASLLARVGVPETEWPPSLVTKATKDIKTHLTTLKQREKNFSDVPKGSFRENFLNGVKDFAKGQFPAEIEKALETEG